MSKKVSVIGVLVLCLIIFSLTLTSLHSQTYTSVPPTFQFTRNLGLGNRGQDVENLQCILGVTQTTGYYGPITAAAVLQFQNAHPTEVLTPIGLTAGTGYMGSSTRAYLNTQISQNASSSIPTCPTYIPLTPTEPTPAPITYQPQPLPQPTQPTQPTQNTQPPQQLPITPIINPDGTVSYLNPNATSTLNPYGTIISPYGTTNPYNPYQSILPTYRSLNSSNNSQGYTNSNAANATAAINVSQGTGSIAGLPTVGVYNPTMRRNEPYAHVVTDSSGSPFVGDIVTTFGGPRDHDIDPVTGHDLNLNHLPIYPACTAHSLNPNAYYMAFRWDYTKPQTTFAKLRSSYVRFYNPKTRLYALAMPVDWGPSPVSPSKATIDVSEGTLKALGAEGGDKIYFQMVPASGPLKSPC